jgi:phage terminase large subunit-like protein
VEEFKAFGPECKHDDQVDAVSGAIQALVGKKKGTVRIIV